MRHTLPSEPSQIGPAGRLPGNTTPPIPQSVDTATIELLSTWQREDATTDAARWKAAEEELAVFMEAINEARTASGEPLAYP